MADLAGIKKQVEFYFSDSNYRKDAFLRQSAEADSEGFVPISILLTFNKLKQLTTDVAVVADALKDSDTVVINSTGDKLKRATPLPDVDTSAERTLYVKGYPVDDTEVTIESIAAQFSAYGKVNMVKLRKTIEKTFKGSALVEFSTAEEMNAAIKAAHDGETVTLAYKGVPLTHVTPFMTWHNEKQAYFAKRKGEKRKLDEVDNVADREDAEKQEEEFTFESGLVFDVKGVPADVNALQLKQFFKAITEEVKFIDLVEGGAVLRVASKAASDAIVAKAAEGLNFTPEGATEAHVLTATLLTGEAENNYWQKFKVTMRERGEKGRGGGRGRGRGGRGGRGGKHQRR